MFAGHFGLAAAVKAREPELPIWSLIVASQLLDIVFIPLFLTGLETIEPIGTGSKEILIHAGYTHSLAGALLISVAAGWLARRKWGQRSGLVIALTVFSHWLLDLLVHRPDMPVLPGNWGNLPPLGFGLWQWPAVSMMLEASIILAGGYLYFRYAFFSGKERKPLNKSRLRKKIMEGTVVGTLLILSFIFDNI